jgi:hypothetical protein
MTPSDPVNSPSHYQRGKLEAIDAIEAAVQDLPGPVAVSIGNAMKYLWRFNEKGGKQDLDKAVWYINRAKLHLPD